MTNPLLCHLLVGLPGCGKSTFALQLQQQIPDSVIISTDEIRQKLFGNEATQGEWNLVEKEVISSVNLAIAQGKPVIYDATNIKPEWRSSFLDKVDTSNSQWLAWWLQTPVEICQEWNLKRTRQVPPNVIEIYAKYLEQTPPTSEEGFIAVKEFNPIDSN